MIKALIFDYGGVVSRGGVYTGLPEKIAGLLGVTVERAGDLLMQCIPDFQRGLRDEHQFWESMELAYGSTIPSHQRKIWYTWDEIKPDPTVTTFIKFLKQEGYKLGLLSNVEPHTAQLLRAHGAYALFDDVVLSCESGYCKPDTEFYTLPLTHMNVLAGECVYIDDKDTLLLPAMKLGMQTVHAVTPEQMIEDVRDILTK